MQTKINRRKFIQNSVLGSAGLFLAPTLATAGSVFTSAGEGGNLFMSGLTPVSIIDNACMLAFRSGELSPSSQKVVTTDIHLRNTPGNKGRLAVVMPPFDNKLIDLVKTVKNQANTRFIMEKRVIAFGWAAVNAVQNHINRSLENKDSDELMRIRMHQDALVIQGFSLPEYDITKASPEDMEDMLNSVLVRTITRSHTLKPDSDDGIGWVNRMAAWRRENTASMKQFANAIVSPDISIAGSSFYDRKDELISAANKLQKAQDVKAAEIMDFIGKGAASNYGKALTEATENIFAIDAFLEGKLSESELSERLNLS